MCLVRRKNHPSGQRLFALPSACLTLATVMKRRRSSWLLKVPVVR